MSFISNFFNMGFPSKKDLETLNDDRIKNKIQLLYEFENMVNKVSIRWLEYDDHLNLLELYENRLKEVKLNFLSLDSPINEDEEFSKNVFWGRSLEEIIEFKKKANVKDLESEIVLYRKIFESLNLSTKEQEYSKEGFKTMLKSIKDVLDNDLAQSIYDILQNKIKIQMDTISGRIAFSKGFKDSIRKDHIFDALKQDFINDCLIEDYDEEIIMAYAHDDNYVKSEIVVKAFAYGPYGSTSHQPSDKGYNYDTLVKDIVKYRTQINEKESLEYLSEIKKELNEISKTIGTLLP